MTVTTYMSYKIIIYEWKNSVRYVAKLPTIFFNPRFKNPFLEFLKTYNYSKNQIVNKKNRKRKVTFAVIMSSSYCQKINEKSSSRGALSITVRNTAILKREVYLRNVCSSFVGGPFPTLHINGLTSKTNICKIKNVSKNVSLRRRR